MVKDHRDCLPNKKFHYYPCKYIIILFAYIGHCINYIYVMAYTSNIANAQLILGTAMTASGCKLIKGLVSTQLQILPDLPLDNYIPIKGDLQKLSLTRFFGFTTCTCHTE